MLDADDLWLPGYLEGMARALRRDTEAGFAYTSAWILDESTGRIRRKPTLSSGFDAPPTSDQLMLSLVNRNFVYTSATVRRAILETLGGYDERFWQGEDFELWLRIASAGHRATRAEGVLAVHREHHHSLTSDTVRALTRSLDLFETISREHANDRVRELAQGRRRTLARNLSRRVDPTPLQRLENSLRRTYTACADRFRWFDEPPEEVARTLASVRG